MAKEKKLKVPKRIAGVKVPKKARKTANKALALAENPMARQLAVAALTAAAAALSEKKVETAANADAGAGGEGGDRASDSSTLKLGDLVAVAALEGARRLLEKAKAAPEAETAPAPARPDPVSPPSAGESPTA